MGFLLSQLKNISFTRKLYYLILLLSIKLVLVVGALAWVSWLGQQEARQEQSVQELNETIWDSVSRLQALNSTVHQYILHHQTADRLWVEQNLPLLQNAFTRLQGEGLLRSSSAHLQESLQTYSYRIRAVFRYMEQYGLTPEEGLQGEMRADIHRVEHLVNDVPEWEVQLLLIRRNEKDFMLRMNMEYGTAVKEQAEALLAAIVASQDPNREEMEQRLREYQDNFQQLVTLSLNMRDSIAALPRLWGAVAEHIATLRDEMQKLRTAERVRYEQATQRLTWVLTMGLILILLVTGALLSAIFYGNILKP
ncbi:MAG: hypothetical protein HQL88_11245, partial [Magnetococcales bacterium]|nr:hypothetical protein [Magnetococcales bacterium]